MAHAVLPTYLNILLHFFCCTLDQLNKIDDDIKKLMNRKLEILRAIQGGISVLSSESIPLHTAVQPKDSPVATVQASLEQSKYCCGFCYHH